MFDRDSKTNAKRVETSRRNALTRLMFLLFVILVVGGSQPVAAQSTPSPLPSPTGFVNDYANVIDPETKQRMEEMLTRLKEQQHIQYAVVTVPTTGDQDIFDYSLAVMRGWGIGDVDNPGLLTLVAVNDRKYFTQVSRHLEGDLPDGLVGQIQRDYLVPAFKRGDYSGGLLATAQAFIQTMGERRGFDPTPIIGSSVPAQRPRPTARPAQKSGLSACGIIVIIGVILLLLMASRRGGGGGCLNLLLLNALFNSGRGSSGWGGGGFGGGGGGFGGGGFGGFSGGGGDAGGGGAGGGW